MDQTGSGNNMTASSVSYTSDFPPVKATIGGIEGWRFLGAPGASTTYGELLDPIWTQGYTGSDGGTGPTSNVHYYDEASKSWQAPGTSTYTVGTSTTNEEGVGQGILVYVYADDDNDGSADPFPKSLQLDAPDALTPVQIPLSYTDSGVYGNDGWNLVSNPYPVALYWQKIVDDGANGNTLNYAYIWDQELNNGAGGYQIHYGEPVPPSFPGGTNTEFDGRIPAFQSFWVKAKQDDAFIRFNASQFIPNKPLYKRNTQETSYLKLTLEGQGFNDELSVIMPASEGQVRDEVPKLHTLSSEYVELYLPGVEGSRWMTRHLTSIQEEVPVTIPVALEANVAGEFSLSWNVESLPEGWIAQLLDKQLDRSYDLSESSAVSIILDNNSSKTKELVLPIAPGTRSQQKTTSPRFELVLKSPVSTGVETPDDLPQAFDLHQNYPNPFNPTTQINYAVPQAGKIQLVVYDMLGREVATLVDDRQSPGRYSVSFDASALASGIYIYRLQSGATVLTRKMTLIK